MGIESTDRPRVHRPRRRHQARPGDLPRGHRPADRPGLRRQREPRQRPRAGPRRPRNSGSRSTSCPSNTSTTRKCSSRRSRSRPTSRRGRRSTSTSWSGPPSRPRGRSRSSRRTPTTGSVPAPGNEKPVPVDLRRGVNVFTLKQLITEPSFYTFTAEFVPEKGSGDRRAINNVRHRVHLRPRHRAGPLDRRHPGRARRTGPRPPREEAGGQGPDRPRRRRRRGAREATSFPDDLGQLQPFDT